MINSPSLSVQRLSELSQQQRERLAYIEFRLYFLGDARRSDLISRFGLAQAASTRDFALYKELFANNIEFDSTTKSYVVSEDFSPVFKHIPERVLTALSQGFGDGINPVLGPLITCELPIAINQIRNDVLAPLTRAIYSGKSVRLNYSSHTSGESEREIVPFAIATDGLRWHVRAFDRKSKDFRDFVISRIKTPRILPNVAVEKYEGSSFDIQWNRILELVLVPHPDRKHPEITINDYNMQNGEFNLNLRAAMAGYFLRQYHVDCSPDHSLKDEAFRLWLKNPLTLYGVNSASFAPGYIIPK